MICPVSNQSPSEEWANRLTHGAGLVLSLLGFKTLLSAGSQSGLGSWLCALVFGLSLIQLFALSTFYHSLPSLAVKSKGRILDHCAIYVLIAGSYTPFMALGLGGMKGWGVLLAVWILAVLGVRFKCTSANPFGVHSVLGFLMMGWMVLLVLKPLMACLAPAASGWLIAGGVAYTLGVPFYAWERLRYSHAIWHLFVLAGAACHYLAVLYVL